MSAAAQKHGLTVVRARHGPGASRKCLPGTGWRLSPRGGRSPPSAASSGSSNVSVAAGTWRPDWHCPLRTGPLETHHLEGGCPPDDRAGARRAQSSAAFYALRRCPARFRSVRTAMAKSPGPRGDAGQILIHGKGGRMRVVLLPSGIGPLRGADAPVFASKACGVSPTASRKQWWVAA
jgi:hypothetical protein